MSEVKRVKKMEDDNIELPTLKKEYKEQKEKYIYNIKLNDVIDLIDNHNIKKDNIILEKNTPMMTREEKNRNNYETKDNEEKQNNIEKNKKDDINNDKNQNNKKRVKKRKLKKGNLVSLIILLIMVPILVFSTYKIINYLIETPKTKDLIKDITDNTEINEYDSNEAEIIKNDEKPNTPYWNFIKMKLIDVNFNTLKKTNSDTVAWLFVGGTNVNYPVVQTNNNDFYLNHSFDKTKNSGGWLFMDYRNDKNEYGRNTIIYGHNMKNQTMFGTLKNLLSKNWYNTEENRIIKMSSENYNTLWQIYSVYTLDTTSDYIQTEFASDDEYQKFINLVKGRSTANFNTTVTTSDKTLTLSTCHGSAKKLVVHAKLIKIEAK